MRSIGRALLGGCGVALGLLPLAAAAQAMTPERQAFFGLYKELVETNTSLSVGSCTKAAAQIAARLRAAGYADADITQFSVPDHPREGGVVAVLAGSDKRVKPMLLLGHLDVVEAKREDWVRDPFTLIEEGDYYYARGTVDDKAMAAVWADAMVRFKTSGYKPKRTIKLALTCGEETTYAFNGAEWLTTRASASCSPSRSARRRRRIIPSRRPIPVATARNPCPTTRSISWPTRLRRCGATSFR
jgi:acetylornithine deacetylase/succinyl-diaminopimelate desuccinylase-like protein